MSYTGRAPSRVKVAHMRLVFYSNVDPDLEYIRGDVHEKVKAEVEKLKRPLWEPKDCPIHVYQKTDEGQRCVNCHRIAGDEL